MKIAICMLVLIGAVVAEPPVPSNHYLPASHGNGIGYANGNGFGTPSSQYGAPLTGNVNGFAAPSAQYGAPSNGYHGLTNGNNGPAYHANGARSNGFKGLTTAIIRPNSQYGAPQRPAAQYGAPSTVYNGGYQEQIYRSRIIMKFAVCLFALTAAVVAEPPVPNNLYLPANHGAPSSNYGAPSNGGGQRPSSQYGAPNTQYGTANGGEQSGNGGGYLKSNGYGNRNGNGGYNY
ncbi:hypothetical protein CBL_20734 [Carabus blaptoides fortunei]